MPPQEDYVVDNAPGATVRADINNHLEAIVTQNSGQTAPAETFPWMIWVDTDQNLIKQRNGANTAWVTIGSLSGSTWIPYRAGAAQGTASTRDVGTGSGANLLDRDQLDGRYGRLQSGDRMLFQQTSAPTGWSKVTSGIDNRALRVVTGTAGGSGSGNTFTGAFRSNFSHNHGGTNNTTLSTSQIPSHTHSAYSPSGSGDARAADTSLSGSTGSGATGGGESHSHGISDDGSHTHSVSVGNNGSHSHTVDVRSRYYALAFIMRTS